MNTSDNMALAVIPPEPAPPSAQPRSRFANAAAVMSVIGGREKELLPQKERDGVVFDFYDRVPPYDPDKLAADHEEWRTNVDFGDTENYINEKTDSIHNMLTQPSPLISFRYKNGTPPDVMDRLDQLAQEQRTFLIEHQIFSNQVMDLAFHMASTGLGMLFFHTPGSWHFVNVPRANIIFPRMAQRDSTDMPWLALRREISVVSLIEHLATPEESAALGWNIPYIKKVIKSFKHWGSVTVNTSFSIESAEWVQGVMDNCYTLSSLNGEKLAAYTMLTREWDGSISEKIVVNSLVVESEQEFLFESKQKHECFSDCTVSFIPVVGSSYMEKVRGAGHRILPFAALMNDLECRAVDTTILSGSLMLKAKDSSDLEKAATQIKLGSVYTMIPEDISLDQKSFGNVSQGLVQLDERLQRKLAANSQAFGGPDKASNANTAFSARLQYNQGNAARGFEADRINMANNAFHQNLWKRMVKVFKDTGKTIPDTKGVKELREFWKMAQEQIKITVDDLDWILHVSATSVIGDGDVNNVFMALTELSPQISTLPRSSQLEVNRMMIAARLRRPDLARRWTMPTGLSQDRIISAQAWRISQEEGGFENSDIPQPVQDDDLDDVHAEAHTQYALGVLDNYEQQILSPDQAFAKLLRAKNHTMVHIQRMSLSKLLEKKHALLSKQWQGIDNMMRRMQQQMKDAAEAEKARQLEEIRNPRMTVKEQEEAATAQLQRQLMIDKHETDKALARDKAAAEIELLTQKHMAKLNLDTIAAARTIGAAEPESEED